MIITINMEVIKMKQTINGCIERAKRHVYAGEFDKAYAEYLAIAEEWRGEEDTPVYQKEILPSLKILEERKSLVGSLEEERRKAQAYQEALKEVEGTRWCGSEHKAALISLRGLEYGGYQYSGVNAQHLERRLEEYDSKLIMLWEQGIQQIS